MSKLQDEPVEKVVNEKDLIPAMDFNEEVYGMVQCNHCKYWGRMDGVIEHHDKKWIKFVCPECDALERVRNPEYEQ